MRKLSNSFILGFSFLLIALAPLHAQTAKAPVANAATETQTPTGQAPDDMTAKITELVHAGKYTEAKQLTAGLLIAYPNDQRLIKAKALIERLLSQAGQADAGSSQPAQSAANNTAVQLAGMDKLEYNTLLELARQAQQQGDPEQQRASLRQFMARSSVFLQKHPDQMLLWQLRAAAAVSLNDSMAGYEAGQQLISSGAMDSADTNLQRLLAQLNGKGWLDKQKAEDDNKYGGILGTWKVSCTTGDRPDQDGNEEVFVKSDAGQVEGYFIFKGDVHRGPRPNLRGIVSTSGDVSWKLYLPTISDKNGKSLDPDTAGGRYFTLNDVPGKRLYPSGWQPPNSYVLSADKRTMTMTFPYQTPNLKRDSDYVSQHPVTWTFEKLSE